MDGAWETFALSTLTSIGWSVGVFEIIVDRKLWDMVRYHWNRPPEPKWPRRLFYLYCFLIVIGFIVATIGVGWFIGILIEAIPYK